MSSTNGEISHSPTSVSELPQNQSNLLVYPSHSMDSCVGTRPSDGGTQALIKEPTLNNEKIMIGSLSSQLEVFSNILRGISPQGKENASSETSRYNSLT